MDWTVQDFKHANHAPDVVVNGQRGKAPVELIGKAGETLNLNAAGTSDPDAQRLTLPLASVPGSGPYRKPRRYRNAERRHGSHGDADSAVRMSAGLAAASGRLLQGPRHRSRDSGRYRRRFAAAYVVPPRDCARGARNTITYKIEPQRPGRWQSLREAGQVTLAGLIATRVRVQKLLGVSQGWRRLPLHCLRCRRTNH